MRSVLYLPASASIEEANDWAEARQKVAIAYRGPDGLWRGLAVDPDIAAKTELASAERLRAQAEACRP